ncbi:sulfotransferase [uncultured Maricaulis sp.]|uniref:sulfotransferase n=1 Tax=uncultured Maricaulis sp. TaxID=174710 RepID=UPI0030DC592D|tara:strand:- start:15759 stop:16601 length:843 start_codon:yes stop_codon:yes gene_type:complete
MNRVDELKAVLMCGAGHSGSTLLGMILGSHSKAFYVGEGAKVRNLGDEKKPLRKRVCKICGEGCEVWAGFRWDRESPLYEQISAHVHRTVIIDSTKDEAWIEARAAEMNKAGGQAFLLFLTRDGRAVVNSRIRKYPERGAEAQIRQWMEKMVLSQALFERFEGPKLQVSYENLSTRTESEVRRVCDMMQIEFEPAMLRFAEQSHHVLGGNSGTQFIAAKTRFDDPDEAFVSLTDRTSAYYENHSGGIEIDLRWKQEFDPAHLALFEELAGPLNTQFSVGA